HYRIVLLHSPHAKHSPPTSVRCSSIRSEKRKLKAIHNYFRSVVLYVKMEEGKRENSLRETLSEANARSPSQPCSRCENVRKETSALQFCGCAVAGCVHGNEDVTALGLELLQRAGSCWSCWGNVTGFGIQNPGEPMWNVRC
ncbi:hypothetical protein MARPO_2023s0001, partial [Marchantia polymorpha]